MSRSSCPGSAPARSAKVSAARTRVHPRQERLGRREHQGVENAGDEKAPAEVRPPVSAVGGTGQENDKAGAPGSQQRRPGVLGVVPKACWLAGLCPEQALRAGVQRLGNRGIFGELSEQTIDPYQWTTFGQGSLAGANARRRRGLWRRAGADHGAPARGSCGRVGVDQGCGARAGHSQRYQAGPPRSAGDAWWGRRDAWTRQVDAVEEVRDQAARGLSGNRRWQARRPRPCLPCGSTSPHSEPGLHSGSHG